MFTFSDYLQEASSLKDGEAWGVIDGKFVPCDAKTMIVLRGANKGKKAELPPKKKGEQKPDSKQKLTDKQQWVNVGTRTKPMWVIVDKSTRKVVGGAGGSKNIGMNVVDGKLVSDEDLKKYNEKIQAQRALDAKLLAIRGPSSRKSNGWSTYSRNGRRYWADSAGEPTGDPVDDDWRY